MEKYDLVLLGATFLSFGIADAYKGSSVIIDGRAKPGYEFIDSFHCGRYDRKDIKTENGRRFADFFESRGLCDDMYIPEWTGYLSKWVYDKGLSVLLFTETLGVERISDDLFKVTVFNANGRQEIYAGRVIDTRVGDGCEKTLSVLSCGGKAAVFDRSMAVKGGRGEISIIEIEMPATFTIKQARERVIDIWMSRPPELEYLKIAAISEVFFEKPEAPGKEISEGYCKLYSAYYDHPLTAFDKGCEKGAALC